MWTVDRRAPGIYGVLVNRAVAGLRAAGLNPNGVQVTSWWRSRTENDRVGGEQDSQHLLGLALDIATVRNGLAEQKLQAAGLIAIDFGAHVHIQALPAGLARSSGLLASLGL